MPGCKKRTTERGSILDREQTRRGEQNSNPVIPRRTEIPVEPSEYLAETGELNQILSLDNLPSKTTDAHRSGALIDYNRDFVMCGMCYWTATVFKTELGPSSIDICPACSHINCLSIIPLAKDEEYRFTIDTKRGLDIEFRTSRSTN